MLTMINSWEINTIYKPLYYVILILLYSHSLYCYIYSLTIYGLIHFFLFIFFPLGNILINLKKSHIPPPMTFYKKIYFFIKYSLCISLYKICRGCRGCRGLGYFLLFKKNTELKVTAVFLGVRKTYNPYNPYNPYKPIDHIHKLIIFFFPHTLLLLCLIKSFIINIHLWFLSSIAILVTFTPNLPLLLMLINRFKLLNSIRKWKSKNNF